MKKQEDGFLGTLFSPLAASVLETVIFSVVKGITGKGVMIAERGYYKTMNKNF